MAEEYKIVRLNDGRIVEAKIRAVIEHTNALHLQVDYGRLWSYGAFVRSNQSIRHTSICSSSLTWLTHAT